MRRLKNDASPRALFLSSVPPIPRDFGNRNRVYQTWDFLDSNGFKIDFVLYPFDYDWVHQVPAYAHRMCSLVDMFVVVPNTRLLHQPAADQHHLIDEWWDASIELHLSWLAARRTYDVVFVNYVFFSKALDLFDNSVLKILDTHDKMSGRKEIFAANNVPEEFFYTTPDQESIGLNRAQVVLAIKASEAADFRELCTAEVLALPFRAAPCAHERSAKRDGEPQGMLRVGFIGAENSVNIVNLRRFFEVYRKLDRLYAAPLEFRVAGNVCKGLKDLHFDWLKLLGRVEDVEGFYAEIDVIAVPLEFSTGQKIKVAEALAYGKPIVSTQNGFDGFSPQHPLHGLATLEEVGLALVDLAYGEFPLEALADSSRLVDAEAALAVERGFDQLSQIMGRRFARVVFVVDRPFWHRKTLGDELWYQAVEYIRHLAPVVVLAIGVTGADTAEVMSRVQVVACDRLAWRDTLPAIIKPLAVVCPDEATRARVKEDFGGTVLVLGGGDSEDHAIIVSHGDDKPVTLVFPRFLPPALDRSEQVETGSVDVIYHSSTNRRLLASIKAEFPLLRFVEVDGERFFENTLAFIAGLVVVPTVMISIPDPIQSILARIAGLRRLKFSILSETSERNPTLTDRMASALCDLNIKRENGASELVRSDIGWETLWQICEKGL